MAMGNAKKNQGKQGGAAGFGSRPVQSAHAQQRDGGGRGGFGDRGGRGGRGGGGRGGRGGGGGGGRGPDGSARHPVPLTSNHFRLNCGFTKHVYQYALRILPDEIFDASRVNDILKTKHRYIYKLMGSYAASG